MADCPPIVDRVSSLQSFVVKMDYKDMLNQFPRESIIDSYDYFPKLDYSDDVVFFPKTVVKNDKREFSFNTNYNVLIKNLSYYNTIEKALDSLEAKKYIFSENYDLNFIKKNTTLLIQELFILGADYVSSEVTLDESVLLTSNFSDKKVFCEVYFDKDDEVNQIEVITNIYENKKQIFTSVSDIQGTIESIYSTQGKFIQENKQKTDFNLLSEASGAFEGIQDYRNIEYEFG